MAPMNDNAALVEKAAKMYPAIQEVLFSGDQLLAFPINIQAYSWTLNQTLWDQFELGEAPSTYTGIWERMSHWDDALAEEYPEYKLLDMDQDVTNYVTALVREYVLQNEQEGTPLSFDTPALREALLALIDHQYLLRVRLKAAECQFHSLTAWALVWVAMMVKKRSCYYRQR